MSAPTVTDLIERALAAYADLELLGEEIEDEWTYVTDLEAAWRARLEAVSGARGSEPVAPAVDAAVDRAIEEIGLIADPHRAIDWLSTFPQVVLVAARRADVRFQDAARDARAVVYAGIQADPSVAHAADCWPTRRRPSGCWHARS